MTIKKTITTTPISLLELFGLDEDRGIRVSSVLLQSIEGNSATINFGESAGEMYHELYAKSTAFIPLSRLSNLYVQASVFTQVVVITVHSS